jgi:hypothetical protein
MAVAFCVMKQYCNSNHRRMTVNYHSKTLVHGDKFKYRSNLPINLTLENVCSVVNYHRIFITLAAPDLML